jgi:hypothetical protein
MDHHLIEFYLSLKGLSLLEIYNNLTETLDIQVVIYSTLTRYPHITSFTDPIEVNRNPDRLGSFPEIDDTNLNTLADESFSSLRNLIRHTYLSRTSILRHITGSFGLTIRYFRWVPYRLPNTKK